MSFSRPGSARTSPGRPQRHFPWRFFALAAAMAAGMVVLPTARARAVSSAHVPAGFGFDVALRDAERAAGALPDLRGKDSRPPVLRVRLSWADFETATSPAWTELDRSLDAAVARGAVVVLVLAGPSPDGSPPVALGKADAYLAFVTAVADRSADRVGAYALWEHANDPGAWGGSPSVVDYAFLLKKAAVAVRGADPGAAVVQGALRASATFQADLLDEGVAPFLDAYGVEASQGEGAEHSLARTEAVLREGDPAAPLWLHHLPLAEPVAETAWAAGLAAQASTHALSTHDLPVIASEDASRVAQSLETLARAFPPDAALAVSGGRSLVSFPSEAKIDATHHVVASDLSSRVAYGTRARALPGTQVVARVGTDQADGFRIFNPTGEHDGPVGRVERGRDSVALWLPLPQRPLVLAFERTADDTEVEEAVSVAGQAQLSVEEILARHLGVQASREHAIRHYVADLRTDMRYALGSSGQAVKVGVESRYFHDANGPEEIENLRFYLNGALHEPKKRVPEIPLLQPEKVTVVPLDVHLDRTYSYRLDGTDQVDGRKCWRVLFEPLGDDQTRWAGTVWIDAETYDRLKVRQVQTHLEPPVSSNEQVDHFASVRGEDGVTHWLVTKSESQRVVSIIGASVAVDSRMTFDNFVVNGETFTPLREEARASAHQMLRDTDEGLRYLRPVEGGGREVAEEKSKKVLAIFGARLDSSYEHVLPLGGVNWLDNDFKGTGLQANFFIAGAINTVSLADPSLWGTRLEGAMNLFAPFVARRERVHLPGLAEDESQGVKVREPTLNVSLGLPVGRLGKVFIGSEISHQSWKRDDDTASDFVLPSDGVTTSLGVDGELHAKGWNARTRVEHSWRHDWNVWGPGGGVTSPDFYEPGDDTYWTWNAGVDKAWFFGQAQTFSFATGFYGGSGLDRFSQREFQAFGGPQLAGFDGSGIRFDEAAVLRVGYGVDVAGLFGLKLSVEHATTRNRSLPASIEAAFGEWSDHQGIGVGGTVPGPWGTIVSFDVGYALRSEDHADVEGDVTAQVLFLKLIK